MSEAFGAFLFRWKKMLLLLLLALIKTFKTEIVSLKNRSFICNLVCHEPTKGNLSNVVDQNVWRNLVTFKKTYLAAVTKSTVRA